MYTYDDEAEKLASSDLGVDQSVQGGVGDSERIFALQDAEFEHESAEGLIEHIDQAGDDMVNVLETHAMVVESIGSNNKAQMAAALVKARGLRRHLSSRYGSHGCSLPVVESIHVPVATVFALEEEAEEEVGFLRRIFRSIANAFKWLWEKLTGVFKSGEKKGEDVKDKADEAAEKIKSLEANPEKNESRDVTVSVRGSDENTMDWFGKDLSFQNVIRRLEELDHHLTDANRGVEDLKHLGKFLTTALGVVKTASKEDGEKVLVQFNEKLSGIVSRWPQQDKNLLKEKDIQNRTISSVHGFDQLPTGKGFLAVSYRENDTSGWEFVTTDGVFMNVGRIMPALTIDEMNKAHAMIEKIRKSAIKLNTVAITVTSLDQEIDRAINGILDKNFQSDDQISEALKEITKMAIRPLVRSISSLAIFYGRLPMEGLSAAGFMGSYVVLSAMARKVKPSETPSEKKE